MPSALPLVVMPQRFAVCRLSAGDATAATLPRGGFHSVTHTSEETSLVCEERYAPATARISRGWRGLRVVGPLPFEMVGVLAGLAGPLAQAGVSTFVVSTYDTDYLFVQEAFLEKACATLSQCGYLVRAATAEDGRENG